MPQHANGADTVRSADRPPASNAGASPTPSSNPVPGPAGPGPVPDELRAAVARLSERWRGLPDKPEETPESTARALWFAAADDPRSAVRSGGALPPLSAEGARRFRELVAARIGGTPLAHLTGRQSFMGLELLAGPGAMLPRWESELLGIRALACLRESLAHRSRARVLDVCTGSGNLAVALAAHEPDCTVVAVDISPEALALARQNAARCGVGDRVAFLAADLFEALDPARCSRDVDLVIGNPPYISTARLEALPPEIARHEPRAAFDGGPLGIGLLVRILKDAPRHLRPGSWLCLEVGDGQGEGMVRMMRSKSSWERIEGVPDETGRIRVIAARTPGSDEDG